MRLFASISLVSSLFYANAPIAPVHAQRAEQPAFARASLVGNAVNSPSLSLRSSGRAGVESVIQPGAGHICVGEGGLELGVVPIYFAGAAVVYEECTDIEGKVAGFKMPSTYQFGSIDGTRAAARYNTRLAATK